MSRWFRFYEEVLDDPKAQRLPLVLFKAWVNILCLASKNNGNIPVEDVSFALRVTEKAAEDILSDLGAAGLIDEFEGTYSPHNWGKRQYKSDVSDPTAAERMRRHRNAHRNATVTVTVPRAETEQNRTEKKDLVARKRAPSIKHPLPDDWRPSEDLSPVEQREFEKMRDWAKAGAIRRADWQAQWRNWIRNVGNFQPRQAHGTTQGNGLQRVLGQLTADEPSGREEIRPTVVRLLPRGGCE
jgi:hypothetical protein